MRIKIYKNATTTLAIRQAIKESPLSAYALAKKHGVSQTTTQRWKRQKVLKINLPVLISLTQALRQTRRFNLF